MPSRPKRINFCSCFKESKGWSKPWNWQIEKIWPPGGGNCISSKFGHQAVPQVASLHCHIALDCPIGNTSYKFATKCIIGNSRPLVYLTMKRCKTLPSRQCQDFEGLWNGHPKLTAKVICSGVRRLPLVSMSSNIFESPRRITCISYFCVE